MDITTTGKIPDYPKPYDDTAIKALIADIDKRLNKLETGVVITPVPIHTPVPAGLPFAPTSFYNKKTNTYIKHPQSDQMMAEFRKQMIVNGTTIKHEPCIGDTQYAPTLYIVTDPNIPKVNMRRVNDGADFKIRVPLNAVAGVGGDTPMAIWDKVDDSYFDGWQVRKVNGQWQCSWGGFQPGVMTWDGIFKNNGGASATSLPHLGHLNKLSEAKAGVFAHVGAIQTAMIPDRHVWPATRHDNAGPFYPPAPPEGSIYYLPQSVAIDPSWPKIVKMLVQQGKDYGFVQYDRSGTGIVFGFENPLVYGESWDAYCGGYNHFDTGLLKNRFPLNLLQVKA